MLDSAILDWLDNIFLKSPVLKHWNVKMLKNEFSRKQESQVLDMYVAHWNMTADKLHYLRNAEKILFSLYFLLELREYILK